MTAGRLKRRQNASAIRVASRRRVSSPTSLPLLRLRAARTAGEPRARSVSSSARSGGRRPRVCRSTASRSSTYAPKRSGLGCGSGSLSAPAGSSPSRHARRKAGSSGSSRSSAAHSHRSSTLPSRGFGSLGSARSSSTRARTHARRSSPGGAPSGCARSASGRHGRSSRRSR